MQTAREPLPDQGDARPGITEQRPSPLPASARLPSTATVTDELSREIGEWAQARGWKYPDVAGFVLAHYWPMARAYLELEERAIAIGEPYHAR